MFALLLCDMHVFHRSTLYRDQSGQGYLVSLTVEASCTVSSHMDDSLCVV